MCPSVPISPRSDAACADMVLWAGIEPAADGRYSNADSSRGGGGSPFDRAGCRTSADVRKQLRLRKRKDFDTVFKRGQFLTSPLLVLRSVPNQLPHNRYGFVTSKRLGNAVVRNRVRRRLREGISSLTTRPGRDIVISARALAAQADFHQLKAAVANLFARAGILSDDPNASAKEQRS